MTVAFCLLTGWQHAHAIERLEVTVDYADGRYRVFGRSRVAAPAEFVYATLVDYDNFHKLAPGITETKFLPDDGSGSRLAYTRYESCVLFFCKAFEKIEYIEAHPPHSIEARAIPNLSDFVFNESRWTIENDEDGLTLLTFEADFDPEFWVPPLIGPWAIRHKLAQTAELIGTRIEWMQSRGLTLAQVKE